MSENLCKLRKIGGGNTIEPVYKTVVSGSNYTTQLTVNGLTIGKRYIFAIGQYPDGNKAGISSATGLTIEYKYQTNTANSSSGAPGLLIGIATATSVTVNFPSHNGGISMAVFET